MLHNSLQQYSLTSLIISLKVTQIILQHLLHTHMKPKPNYCLKILFQIDVFVLPYKLCRPLQSHNIVTLTYLKGCSTKQSLGKKPASLNGNRSQLGQAFHDVTHSVDVRAGRAFVVTTDHVTSPRLNQKDQFLQEPFPD